MLVQRQYKTEKCGNGMGMCVIEDVLHFFIFLHSDIAPSTSINTLAYGVIVLKFK